MVLGEKSEKDQKTKSTHHDHISQKKNQTYYQGHEIVVGISVGTRKEVAKCH